MRLANQPLFQTGRITFVNDSTKPDKAEISLGAELIPSRKISEQPNQLTPSGNAEFVPSRKRDLKSMQERAACFDQPTGRALPSLLPCKPTTMRAHLQVTIATNPQNFSSIWKSHRKYEI